MTDISTDITEKPTDINSKELTIIDYLKENDFITNKKVRELLSVSTEAAKRLLQSMVKKGYIIAEGMNKGRRYRL